MMLFSDLDGEKLTATYHLEKHWDNQSIALEDGTRVGRQNSFITGTPGISWHFSKDFHMGVQLQWRLLDLAFIANAQYDFLRTETGKVSVSLMYKGSWLVLSPGAGAQLAFYQMISKSESGPSFEAVIGANTRYVDHDYFEVKTQGEPNPQRSYTDYVGTNSAFGGINTAWGPVIFRAVGGWELAYGIKDDPGHYQRDSGPYVWVELGWRL